MRLSDKQALFAANINKLITWVNEHPEYRIRLDGAVRTMSQQILYYTGYEVKLNKKGFPELVKGERSSKTLFSAHLSRLACDLILDRKISGKWIYQNETQSYAFMNEFWKSLHPQNIWGGDFGWDGNHFEMKGD